MIGNPPVLVLDEPTVGLDPKQIIEIRNLIKKLGRTHTVILSSHILSEIQAVCDRVIIINKGEIAADDTADNLSKKILCPNMKLTTLMDVYKTLQNLDNGKAFEIKMDMEEIEKAKVCINEMIRLGE